MAVPRSEEQRMRFSDLIANPNVAYSPLLQMNQEQTRQMAEENRTKAQNMLAIADKGWDSLGKSIRELPEAWERGQEAGRREKRFSEEQKQYQRAAEEHPLAIEQKRTGIDSTKQQMEATKQHMEGQGLELAQAKRRDLVMQRPYDARQQPQTLEEALAVQPIRQGEQQGRLINTNIDVAQNDLAKSKSEQRQNQAANQFTAAISFNSNTGQVQVDPQATQAAAAKLKNQGYTDADIAGGLARARGNVQSQSVVQSTVEQASPAGQARTKLRSDTTSYAQVADKIVRDLQTYKQNSNALFDNSTAQAAVESMFNSIDPTGANPQAQSAKKSYAERIVSADPRDREQIMQAAARDALENMDASMQIQAKNIGAAYGGNNAMAADPQIRAGYESFQSAKNKLGGAGGGVNPFTGQSNVTKSNVLIPPQAQFTPDSFKPAPVYGAK